MRCSGAGLLWAAALASAGCAAAPVAPPGASGCRAVGRIELHAPGRGDVDATAVVHVGVRSIALRIVAPNGRSAVELRTEGGRVRLTRRDDRTYWEGEGADAMAEILGEAIAPAAFIGMLRGETPAPAGWTFDARMGRACLPEESTLTGPRSFRLRLTLDEIAGWDPGAEALPPPPAGYRRVDELAIPVGE